MSVYSDLRVNELEKNLFFSIYEISFDSSNNKLNDKWKSKRIIEWLIDVRRVEDPTRSINELWAQNNSHNRIILNEC